MSQEKTNKENAEDYFQSIDKRLVQAETPG